MRTIIAVLALALIAAAPPPVEVPVQLEMSAPTPLSGRLIVFAEPAKPGAAKPDSVDANPFAGTPTAVAARDVRSLSKGQVATVDADTDAVPGAWSKLPPGRYHLQAVLDVDGNYNYAGRGAGDVISKVVDVTLPGPVQAVALSSVMPADDPYAAHNPRQQALAAYFPKLLPIDFVSPKLTAFWGRPVHMRGWVALPPDYDARSGKTWPTVYQTHGFGGDVHSARWTAASYLDLMTKGRIPPMIYVTLDESSPTGTHEFADSVNNGPWGAALTTELIPWLEQHYRMDAKPSGRFLTGHSSGGWATLWLQTRYPTVFGGTWSTSPDPSDFHDFTGADLYRANANVYVDAVRQAGAAGAYEGPRRRQFRGFRAARGGPRGRSADRWRRSTGCSRRRARTDGRCRCSTAGPAPSTRRSQPTGATITTSPTGCNATGRAIGKDLDGKIHVIVGTADTFHLDGAAHKLQAVLQGLGAKADVRFLPGKTHMDLYESNGDPQALTVEIAKEMYAVARPNGVVGTAAAGGR